MSDGEDDILFRIGFESHPQAGSKLEALAQSVEMTQKRIDQMFTTTADRVAKAATAMTASLANTEGGNAATPEAAARQQLKSVADAFTQQADRIVALQTAMVSKLEAIRARDVTSADGHAKRLEAIYATTLERLNASVAAAQSGSDAAQKAIAPSDLNGGGVGVSIPTVGDGGSTPTGGASQLEAMAAARKATQEQIVKDTGAFNVAIDATTEHEFLTQQERNDGMELFARARQAIMRGEAEANRLSLAQMEEDSRAGLELIKKDVQLIEDIQNGGGGTAVGATNEDAEQAAARVKAYYDTIQKGIDQVAADEARLAAQQAKDQEKQKAAQDEANRNRRKLIENTRKAEEAAAKAAEAEASKQQADQDAANRNRRKLIENTRKAEEAAAKATEAEAKKQQADQDAANRERRKLVENTRKAEEAAAKQAEADAKKQQADQDAAINRRRKLIENSKNYERQLAREVADEAIAGYEEQTQAIARAEAMVRRGGQQLLQSLEQGANGLGKLARSAVLLGLANGGEMEAVIKQLALVQAGIDLIGGATSTIRGVVNAFQGLRDVILGRIAAQRAENAAGQQAIAGARAVTAALELEALSARDAATAHLMLARARGVVGAPPVSLPGAPASPVAPGSPQVGGRGSFVAGTVGAIAGAGLGALAGSRVGDAVGGDNASQIGTVIGTVAGGIIGQVIATKMLAGLAGRGAGAIVGAFGGRLMAGAGTLAGAIGLGGVAPTSGMGGSAVAAIGGAGVALGASAIAALGGAAFGLKAVVETLKDASKSGLMGGSQVGSFNDTVGSSKYNPFAYLMKWELNATLAQSEAKTKRMENASLLFKAEQENLRNLQRIRLDFESQRKGIDQSTQDAIDQDEFNSLATTGEKLAFTTNVSNKRTQERDEAARRLAGFTETDPNTGAQRLVDDGGTDEAKKALEGHIAATERLIESEKQREQLLRQVATESRQNTLEEIKGIEDVIQARKKEMEQSERQYMSAKERFGAMNVLDQKSALNALEKARAQGVESLSKVERESLGSIGTDESQEMLSRANNKRAEDAGFDKTNRTEFDRREAAMQQSQDADVDKLAEKSGQGRDEIEQRLAKPAQVELVDRTKFEVTLNKQDDVLFDAILAEIKKMRLADRDARIEAAKLAAQRESDAESERFRQQKQQ